MEGLDVVSIKLADVMLCEVASPTQMGATEADVVQKAALRGGPWRDGHGANAMAMFVWVGRQICWQMIYRIPRQVTEARRCVVMSFSQRWRVGLRQKKTLNPVGEKRDISSPGSDRFKRT